MTFSEKITQTVAFGVTSAWKLLYNTPQKGIGEIEIGFCINVDRALF
ncbi:hypothetical protein [Vibrio rumoiensis]|uniref:Uncharacterized protein n=1 Tax=Vibrio rumoiensis TaxID=76258 RepID=A0ABW7ITC7_9VIBR